MYLNNLLIFSIVFWSFFSNATKKSFEHRPITITGTLVGFNKEHVFIKNNGKKIKLPLSLLPNKDGYVTGKAIVSVKTTFTELMLHNEK